MAEDFKPNIYPIMYWGLMYGLIAGFLLFVLFMLSRYLTLVWFPVFLTGVIWGGYRNYKKQKRESGQAGEPKPVLQEFKDAAKDILGATKEMVTEQLQEAAAEDAAKAEQEAEAPIAEAEEIIETPAPEVVSEEEAPTQPETPTPPTQQPEKDITPEQPDTNKPRQEPPVV